MISHVDIKHNGTICVVYQSGRKCIYSPSQYLPKTVSYFIVMAIAKRNVIIFNVPRGTVTTLY